MRVPVSWLRTLVPGLTASADEIAAALVRAGLEVEQVAPRRPRRHRRRRRRGPRRRGADRLQEADPLLPRRRRRPRRTRSSAAPPTSRRATASPSPCPAPCCPATSASPRAQTYGHTSDGMICSGAELGLSDESDGILVLPPDTPLGVDVVELLQLRDEVLDIAVTPDRGYAAVGPRRRPRDRHRLRARARRPRPARGAGRDRRRLPASASRTRTAATATSPASSRGLDPAAPSPAWLQRRLVLAGMRPISLAVDVTNHVMLELGQPLHAFDLDALRGEVVVRRAQAGERLTTLDGQDRALDPDDLLITDDSGPIALAGVMGGGPDRGHRRRRRRSCSSRRTSRRCPIARTARRHRLPSEASRRYERGVDPRPRRGRRGGRRAAARRARRRDRRTGHRRRHPRRRAGAARCRSTRPGGWPAATYAPEVVRRRLEDVGCTVAGDDPLEVVPPPWRPDLTGTRRADRGGRCGSRATTRSRSSCRPLRPAAASPPSSGCAAPPSRALAAGRAGRGRHAAVRRRAGARGARRRRWTCPRLVNPLSAEEALLRPTLLPGLLAAVVRNASRGLPDVALFETGHVFLGTGAQRRRPRRRRPADGGRRVAALDAALPAQPRHLGLALAGAAASLGRRRRRRGRARPRARARAGAAGRRRTVPSTRAAAPSCCSTARRVGLAGELHPRVVAALGLPARTCAAEAEPRRARRGRRGARSAAARRSSRTSRRPRSTSPWSSTPACRPPTSSRRCATAPARCSRSCGCSTSTPARRSARAGARWPTPCACARRTAPSPTSRCSARATPRSPRPASRPAPSCAAHDRRLRRVALVTGGGRGLGRAVARAARRGRLLGRGHRPRRRGASTRPSRQAAAARAARRRHRPRRTSRTRSGARRRRARAGRPARRQRRPLRRRRTAVGERPRRLVARRRGQPARPAARAVAAALPGDGRSAARGRVVALGSGFGNRADAARQRPTRPSKAALLRLVEAVGRRARRHRRRRPSRSAPGWSRTDMTRGFPAGFTAAHPEFATRPTTAGRRRRLAAWCCASRRRARRAAGRSCTSRRRRPGRRPPLTDRVCAGTGCSLPDVRDRPRDPGGPRRACPARTDATGTLRRDLRDGPRRSAA